MPAQSRPGQEETWDNMKQYFIDCARDNLHLILCMSPLNPKFPIRARYDGLLCKPFCFHQRLTIARRVQASQEDNRVRS